ncbi:family 78 glycoside hydrolase catalytic domain, partial [Paenibacillus sp.]|uniref:family 78 glycoside hydrolase catalytic domain n=1 Tax=Paenibacillus sp. TaxID=58172 RepID=UPI002D5E6FE5
CVWKTTDEPRPVPAALQRAVLPSPDPAVLPTFDGLDTELVIDFGRELSGYISFELDAAAGTIVDFYGFEYMKDGWRQHTYVVDNTFRYVCREGRQSYVSYVRRGLRYLTITARGASRPVRLYEVKLLQSNFPVANVGRFRSSDPLLNDIWTISRDTTRLCMEDTFVDCPAFEQVYWVGDARNEALVNYYAFGAKDIVEHCLKLVPGSAFQTPLFADQVPSGWSSVIPNWTFFWVSACREYYEFSGDRAFVEAIWPHVRLTLNAYMALLNEDGLIEREGWNLLDWAPFEQPGEGIVTPQNMFYAKALREGAELGALAGDAAEAERLRETAARVAQAIDARLWDDSRSAYLDCLHADGRLSATVSMQTQIVAYLCDIAGGERKRLIEGYIVQPPASFVQVGSPFMSFFYYEAFAKLGRFDLLLSDMRRNYGFMVEHDATSCWEMYPWSGYNKNPKLLTRSHCHAWSAGPAYFLGAYVLGVQGSSPGWTTVRVAPQLCGLQWATGSVPLPQGGRVDVSWRVEGEDALRLRVEAPAGVELDLVAPEGYQMTVERVAL